MSVEPQTNNRTIPITIKNIDSGIFRPKVAGVYNMFLEDGDVVKSFVIKVKTNHVYYWSYSRGVLNVKEHSSSGSHLNTEKYKAISERKVIKDV